MMIKKILLLTALLFTLVSCSNRDGATVVSDDVVVNETDISTDTDTEISANVSALEGAWVSACEVEEAGASANSKLQFNGNEFTLTETDYVGGEDCSEADIFTQLVFTGTAVEGENALQANGIEAKELDLNFQVSAGAFYDATTIQVFNNGAYCGKTNWELGVSYDLIACSDEEDYLLPVFTMYTLYGLSGDQLYLGNEVESDDGTEASRSTELNIDLPYTHEQ